MSYQPNKWAIGLVPLAVLWILGTTGAERDVERTLSRGVGDAVRNNVERPDIKVRGRDIALRGEAFSHADQKAAVDNTWSVSGVRSVRADKLGVIEAVGPYVWWIVRSADRVTLSGSVPNPQVRAQILDSAKVLGLPDVYDRANYGRGESGELPAASDYAVKLLANMSRGAVTYTDGALDVSGIAANGEGYARALALLKTPPEGVKVSASDVIAAGRLALCVFRDPVRQRRGAGRRRAERQGESGAGRPRGAAFPRRQDRQRPRARQRRLARRAGGGGLGAGRARQARRRQGRAERLANCAQRQGQGDRRRRGRHRLRRQGACGLQRGCAQDRARPGRDLRLRRRARRRRPAFHRLHAERGGARGDAGGGPEARPADRRPDPHRRRACPRPSISAR